MKNLIGAIGAISYLIASQASGTINVVSDTDTGGWIAITSHYHYFSDQQSGSSSGDIVGGYGGSYNAHDAGFFANWDPGTSSVTDGTIGFRIRLDDHDGGNNPDFNGFLWVGVDADSNGSIDAFIGVDKQGNHSLIAIYDAGNDSNDSPDTSSIASNAYDSVNAVPGANYSYRAVNHTTDGGTTSDITTATSGDVDYYLSFTVDFGRLVSFLDTQGIAIDDSTPLRYLVGTATQGQSVNQRLGQLSNTVDPGATWDDLGGFSPAVTATGTVVGAVPEPSTMLLGVFALPCLFRRRRPA